MRILFYNWVDYFDPEKRGGGVSVYQRNVLNALDALQDVEAVFLSSGISYDLYSNRPRWEKVRHGSRIDRDRRFEIVNSGVLSPSHHSFGNAVQLDHPETVACLKDFMRANGPFDVVHFNNLEGLPASALDLKDDFPGLKVIFSLHNYYPFCPQVNLWYDERSNCTDFKGGRKCETCLPHKPDERIIRLANAVAFNLKKGGVEPGTRLFDRAFMPGMRLGGRAARAYSRFSRRGKAALAPPVAPEASAGLLTRMAPAWEGFADRREKMVAAINAHCDRVLCVSARVGEVAERFGVDPELIQTSYIGTKQYEKYLETSPKPALVKEDGTLTLAYLGYMRRDKGFFFLLDCLEKLNPELAARINLVVCARRGDDKTMNRLADLSERFGNVLYADGYSHDDLDELLADVDVGLVPVLWEDNLPQVAIEMHARHIPLLTSDLGGAQELGNCPEMVFKAGNMRSFHAKIANILYGRIDAQDYWKDAMAPVSMPAHIAELLAVYGQDPKAIAAKLEDAEAAEPAEDQAKDQTSDQTGSQAALSA